MTRREGIEFWNRHLEPWRGSRLTQEASCREGAPCAAGVSRAVGDRLTYEAGCAARIGSYARREQDWAFQSTLLPAKSTSGSSKCAPRKSAKALPSGSGTTASNRCGTRKRSKTFGSVAKFKIPRGLHTLLLNSQTTKQR